MQLGLQSLPSTIPLHFLDPAEGSLQGLRSALGEERAGVESGRCISSTLQPHRRCLKKLIQFQAILTYLGSPCPRNLGASTGESSGTVRGLGWPTTNRRNVGPLYRWPWPLADPLRIEVNLAESKGLGDGNPAPLTGQFGFIFMRIFSNVMACHGY